MISKEHPHNSEASALEARIKLSIRETKEELYNQSNLRNYVLWCYLAAQTLRKKIERRISLVEGKAAANLNESVDVIVIEESLCTKENLYNLVICKNLLDILDKADNITKAIDSVAISKMKLFIQQIPNLSNTRHNELARAINSTHIKFILASQLNQILKSMIMNSLQWHIERGLNVDDIDRKFLFSIAARNNNECSFLEYTSLDFDGFMINVSAPLGTSIFRSPDSVYYRDNEFYETQIAYYKDLDEFRSKKKTFNQELLIPVNTYCSICMDRFNDYFQHIKSAEHRNNEAEYSNLYEEISELFDQQARKVFSKTVVKQVFKVMRVSPIIADKATFDTCQITLEQFIRKPYYKENEPCEKRIKVI